MTIYLWNLPIVYFVLFLNYLFILIIIITAQLVFHSSLLVAIVEQSFTKALMLSFHIFLDWVASHLFNRQDPASASFWTIASSAFAKRNRIMKIQQADDSGIT